MLVQCVVRQVQWPASGRRDRLMSPGRSPGIGPESYGNLGRCRDGRQGEDKALDRLCECGMVDIRG